MNCQEARPLRDAYSDGELDSVRTIDVEQHLGACRGCAQAFENVRRLRSLLKSEELYFPAPAGLERRVRLALRPDGKAATGRSASWRLWLRLALPTTGLALAALLLVVVLKGPSADERLAQEVTSGHIRSLMADHKTDVASSDQHTVKPWFDGRLDFAPPVIDLAERGYPLVGGRLDYLQNRPVAALVYQRHRHFLNLFIWPAANDSNTEPKLATRQGYNLIQWNQAGMTFWAVSDLNPVELREFVNLFSRR